MGSISQLSLCLTILSLGCSPLGRATNTSETAGASGEKILDVPHLCQYVNTFEPDSTCNNTSLAMVVIHYELGGNVPIHVDTSGIPLRLADRLFMQFGKTNSMDSIAEAGRRLGFKNVKTVRTGTNALLKQMLNTGAPVIVGGDFTGDVGHFVVVVGYNEMGFVVADPAGRWDMKTLSPGDGYGKQRCREDGGMGNREVYEYEAFSKAINRNQGHFIILKP